jgi:hypothetical protein
VRAWRAEWRAKVWHQSRRGATYAEEHTQLLGADGELVREGAPREGEGRYDREEGHDDEHWVSAAGGDARISPTLRRSPTWGITQPAPIPVPASLRAVRASADEGRLAPVCRQPAPGGRTML